MSNTNNHTNELQKFIAATLHQVAAIPIAQFEEDNTDVAGSLVPRVVIITLAATEVLQLVAGHYGSSSEGSSGEGSSGEQDAITDGQLCNALDNRLGSFTAASAGRDIADLAVMARMGLQWRIERAQVVAAQNDRWKTISQMSSARREVIKSVTAVDIAICRSQGRGSANEHYLLSEVHRSVEVRRCYVQLFRELTREGEVTADQLVRRLRLAATCLTKLTSKAIYPDLRIADRVQVRSLQSRMLDWLRAFQNDAAQGVQAGLRLNQDLQCFAELLLAVNNRSELRDYDLLTIGETLPRLEELPPAQPVPAALRSRLDALAGRDEGIDRLLADPASHVGAWIVPLLSVQQRLGGGVKEGAHGVIDGDFL